MIFSLQEYLEKRNIQFFCNNINSIFINQFGTSPIINQYGSKNNGHYTINIEIRNSSVNVHCLIALYYPRKSKLITKNDNLEKMTETKIDKILTKRQVILYGCILDFTVSPKGCGIGTLLMNSLMPQFKIFPNINYILLHPQDDLAKMFWQKIGFKDTHLAYGIEIFPTNIPHDMFYRIHK